MHPFKAWRRERLATFEASMAVLAACLVRIASAHKVISANEGLPTQLRSLGAALGKAPRGGPSGIAKGLRVGPAPYRVVEHANLF